MAAKCTAREISEPYPDSSPPLEFLMCLCNQQRNLISSISSTFCKHLFYQEHEKEWKLSLLHFSVSATLRLEISGELHRCYVFS